MRKRSTSVQTTAYALAQESGNMGRRKYQKGRGVDGVVSIGDQSKQTGRSVQPKTPLGTRRIQEANNKDHKRLTKQASLQYKVAARARGQGPNGEFSERGVNDQRVSCRAKPKGDPVSIKKILKILKRV